MQNLTILLMTHDPLEATAICHAAIVIENGCVKETGSSSIEEMRGDARVLIMHGTSRVKVLFDSFLCARGCDGTVCTPDRRVDKRVILSTTER